MVPSFFRITQQTESNSVLSSEVKKDSLFIGHWIAAAKQRWVVRTHAAKRANKWSCLIMP